MAVPSASTVVPALPYAEVLNQNQGEFISDEIRLGDTAIDAGAVPEPGAVSLLCLAALSLLTGRRRPSAAP